jgi:sugar lactone lactonase YvrE
VVTLAISLPSAFGQDTAADLVLGQGDFTSHWANAGSGSTNGIGLNLPFAVALDRSIVPNRVYVSDYNNNRVLGWANISALTNGAPADLVIGQPNFTAGSCNTGGISARTLCVPMGLAVDGAGNLHVVDRGNSRVLVYFTPFTTDAIADRVIGQINFTSGGCSNPSTSKASAGSMCTPTGVAVDGVGNVYVTDMTNNRALEYDLPLSTDTIADRVFGQSNYTSKNAGSGTNGLNQPYGIAVDGSGHVYISDFGNNRVLEYNMPSTTDSIADRVFGQPNFNNNTPNTGGVSASSLRNPSGVALDGMGNLYVADRSNNRVLEYAIPLATDTIADAVFGQPNYSTVSCNKGGLSANSLCLPTGGAMEGSGDLWVADYANQRVLKFKISSGEIAPGALNQARSGHTATVQSDGTVLIAGGQNTNGFLSTAEKFYPQTLLFGELIAQLQTPRADQSATLLADGSVLAIGGRNAGGVLDTAELYNPGTGQFSNLSDSPQIGKFGHTATALLDGRVLIVGGQNVGALDSSEEFDSQSVLLFKPSFDPTAGVFVILPHALSTPRWDHAATLLPDGRVLVTGGRNEPGYLSTAELFDPATESFTTLPAGQATPRAGHTATLMPDGTVLILGGQNDTGYLNTAEKFDPALGTFTAVATGLTTPRSNHTATLLHNGEILITGGENQGGILDSTENYGAPSADSISPNVIQIRPPDQAVGKDLTEIVGVRFSEPVDIRTLNASNISLTGSGAVDAIIGPSEQGLMVFIVPKAKLSPGTTYTLTLTSGVKDTAGNPLTAFTSRFTTVAAPAITDVTPNHGPEGSAITITGQNFDPSAPTRNVVKIKGVAAFVTSATATKLETSVPLNAPIGAGTLEVTTSGGTVATSFTVENPVPTLVRLTPDSLIAGSGAFTLTLSGENFIPASSVSFGSTVLATTFVSGTQLQANLPATAVATAGIFLVTVTNPAPGGGSSAAVSFTVNNPVPNAAFLFPTSVSVGVEATTVAISGTDFSPGATVQLNGSPLATTFNNSMQISASIPASLLTMPGQFTITVVNPSPGGGISAGLVFTVQESGLRIDSISPNQLSQGSVHRLVTITGSGIQPGASVQVSGTGVTVAVSSVSSGYSVQDNRSSGPTFSWKDATGGTLALSQCDDCASDLIPIGFPMNVFGQPVTSFYINNNGLITFGESSDEYQNTGLPLLDSPNFYFAPFWDDLLNGSVYVQTFGVAPNRVTAVQWDHVSTCCDEPAASDFTFEILLHESTNVITFQYLELSGVNFDGQSATVGIEGPFGREGISYLVSGTPQSHLLSNGLAVTFSPSDYITAAVSVVEDATLGHRDVIVTNPDGGTETIPALLSITQNPIQLSITTPVSGNLTGRATISVQGTTSAASGEIGVAVNGVGAQKNGNRFAANHVPLVLGENTITAIATDMNGNSTSASVAMTVVDQLNFAGIFANPESGAAPLDVNFSSLATIANPIVNYALDADGDGTVDFNFTAWPDTVQFRYNQPGLYVATLTLTDDQGDIYSDSMAINVYSLQDLDLMLQSKWSGMKVALTNKDVEGAVRFFAGSAQEIYRQNFTLMMDVLSQIVSDMGPIQFVRSIKNGAIYEMKAVQDGQEHSFYVEFVLDVDGQWKIRFF